MCVIKHDNTGGCPLRVIKTISTGDACNMMKRSCYMHVGWTDLGILKKFHLKLR